MKLLKCADDSCEWTDLLPFKEQSLVISEFDAFKDFLAIYCKRNGVPEIVIQDLGSLTLKTVSVDSEVGEILPGLNSDYESMSLNFTFTSPFVFQ